MEEQKQDNQENKPYSSKERGFFEEIIGESFDLDRGLLATIIYMFKSPGEVIDSYFYSKGRFTNPFRYTFVILAFTTLIATFLIDYETFFKSALEAGSGESLDQMISELNEKVPEFNWEGYFENTNYISVLISTKLNSLLYILVLVPPMAFFSRLFFKKKKSRYIEHFVMNLYTVTQFALFSFLTIPIFLYVQSLFLGLVIMLGLLSFFATWAYKDYLQFAETGDYIISVVSILLSYLVYSIIVAFIIYGGAIIKLLYFD